MDKEILIAIQRSYNFFSEMEKRLGDYIMENYYTIENMNIKELAKIVGTSNSTITRFCKKIGCESFIELKMKLSLASAGSKEEDNDIFNRVYNNYHQIVECTKNSLNKEDIDKLTLKIKESRRISIYATGSAGLIANEFKYRLERIGYLVDSITDSHRMLINGCVLREGDMAIGISASGFTQEVIQGLQAAKDNKAYTVSVTNFKNSDITSICDINLYTYNSKFIKEKSFINSGLSTLYLIDIISMMLLEDVNTSDKLKDTISKVKRNKILNW